MMEVEWVHKRTQLWRLLQSQPRLSVTQLARLVGMSLSWVRKWRERLVGIDGQDIRAFMSRSRRRLTSPKKVTEAVEAKILHLREYLTEQYHRRVGARNILYHLHNDPDLKQLGVYIPRAASTVHEILVRYNRIPQPKPRIHVPREPAEPLQVWEIDFTDVVTARSPETEKRQHQVEVFNIVDTGTSIALETAVSDQYDAQNTLIALIDVFQSVGLPRVLRFDRDPRFVASWSMDKFPSTFMRFLWCLGVTPDVCPPRRPDLKPYVERFIRTQKEECIYPKRPASIPESRQLIGEHRRFYNLERPNQAVTCGNQPPSRALEQVPRLPQLPAMVDPDAWLQHYHRQGFRRRVRSNGTVTVDNDAYYVGKRYAGQRVLLVVDAAEKCFEIWHNDQCLNTRPIRNLFHGQLPLADYIEHMSLAAQSEEKRLKARRRYQQRVA
jgi:hypothetical protein